MENKKIITEELSRIKNLMGYDRSKTLNENINEGWFDTLYDTVDGEIARYLLPSGDIITADKLKGGPPKGSVQLNSKDVETALGVASGVKTASSLLGGGGSTVAATGAAKAGAAAAAEAGAGAAAATAEVGAAATTAAAAGGEAAAATTFLGLGPVGWTIIGVAGIAALGYWAATKDDKMSMIKNLFGICKSSKDKNKWKRYMSDTEVRKNSGILYHAMEGLGTDEPKIYDVFRLFKSPGDFCAVSEKYESTFDESLLDALDGDFDYGWEPIAKSLVDMTKNYAQTEAEDYCKTNVKECADKLKLYCEKTPDDPKCKVLKTNVVDFKNCNGEYYKGCKGPKIVQVQKCLGVDVDGKFGDETEKKLEEKIKSKTFKDEDVKTICDKK
jgi:hypothetical protein